MKAEFTATWDNAALRRFTDAGAKGLEQAGEHLLDESVRVAPIDESTLIKSAATSVDTGAKAVAVSYDTPYAIRQHEDMSLRHEGGRTAKYLETPLTKNRAKLMQIITAAYRKLT